MLDMDRRIRPLRLAALSVLAVCLVISTPWLGLETIAMLVVAVAVAGTFFKLAGSRTDGANHPEYVLFSGWAASVVIIAICVAITGGIESPAMAWMAIPVVTLSARFSSRGVIAGVVFISALMAIVCLAVSASETLDDPVYLGSSIALTISIAILSTALMQSDFEHRSEAVIDPLTGLLNRAALRNRTLELSQRSEYTAEPVGVIVADIDHFKQINDSHGHSVGDAVLKDIAYVLRKELRAFDLAYRIGGEEFLVLLPGANVGEAEEFAEQLHKVLSRDMRGGQHVTLSFGVSASRYGDVFDYDRIFEQADAALYRAKNGGRNQVCVADELDSVAGPDAGFTRHVRI